MYQILPPVKNGQTSNVIRFTILDSTVTTYAGKTGLAFNTSGIVIGTIADGEATAVAYTTAGSTTETITTLGTFAAPTATKARFKEVDATNLPGTYELQLADARFAVAGAKYLDICVSGMTGAAATRLKVPLTVIDPNALGTNTLLQTTIATLTNQTTFTLTAGSTITGTYAGCGILITSATTGTTKAFGVISTYTGSTKGVVLVADPAIFTMAANDLVTIYTKSIPNLAGQTLTLNGPTIGPSTGSISVG